MALDTAFRRDDVGASGTPGVSSTVAAAVSLWGTGNPHHISPGSPPIVMFHGTNDTTIPFPLAAGTCAQTIAQRNVCEPTFWPGKGHGGNWATGKEEIVGKTAHFLCRWVHAGCP